MNIRWNEQKNIKLKKERRVSFEDIICDGEILDSIENPSHKNQKRLVISY